MFSQLKKVLNEETNLKKGCRPSNATDSLIPSIQITNNSTSAPVNFNPAHPSLLNSMIMFPHQMPKPMPQTLTSNASLINQQQKTPPPAQQPLNNSLSVPPQQANINPNSINSKPQSPFHAPQHLLSSPHHLGPNPQNCKPLTFRIIEKKCQICVYQSYLTKFEKN